MNILQKISKVTGLIKPWQVSQCAPTSKRVRYTWLKMATVKSWGKPWVSRPDTKIGKQSWVIKLAYNFRKMKFYLWLNLVWIKILTLDAPPTLWLRDWQCHWHGRLPLQQLGRCVCKAQLILNEGTELPATRFWKLPIRAEPVSPMQPARLNVCEWKEV